jgi:hypothetical protein
MMLPLRLLFELTQEIQVVSLVFLNPTLVYLVDGDRVEVVELFAPPADGRNKVGVLQSPEVLRDRLARHVQVYTEFPQRLTAAPAQAV